MKTWPFAGRRQELEHLVRLARDPTAQGVLVAGPAGVGKSRLAGKILEAFRPGRVTLLPITATKAASGIPNGALADLIPRDHPPHLVNTLRWAGEELLKQARGRTLVLAVDDAHLLDSHSAEVVASLVRGRQARLVATLRTGEPAPDSMTGLWRDGHVRRLDVEPFSDADLVAVLAAALGGPPDDATARRLGEITEGNALFLQEVVTAARAAGSLHPIQGVWKLTGDPPLAPRLADLIHERIGALSPALKAVLEYTAFAEPVGARTLSALCSEEAVLEAEERGLIKVAVDRRREIARLGHPLYGEVARDHCPELRRRRRHADLVAAVEPTGLRRVEDLVRVTVWRLTAGLGAAPEPLLAACRLAWAAHDYPTAIRLGEAAVEASIDAGTARGTTGATAGNTGNTGNTAAAIQLATVLDYAQQPDRARAVLDAVPPPRDEPGRARLVQAVASNLAWGMDRLGDALDLLATTEKSLRDPALRLQLATRRLSLTASAARPADALHLSDTLLTSGTPPPPHRHPLTGPPALVPPSTIRPVEEHPDTGDPVPLKAIVTGTSGMPVPEDAPLPQAATLPEEAALPDAVAFHGEVPGQTRGVHLGPVLRAQVLNSRALALCYSGHTREAAELVREALDEAQSWRDGIPALVSPLHSTWAMCGYFAGDLPLMDQAIASMRAELAGQRGWSRGEGSLALSRGHAATLRGELGAALLILHSPANHETAVTVGGCMGAYAAVQALRGDAPAARATLRAALDRNRATWTAFTRWVALTRVWIAAAAGELEHAAELALTAAAECREAGLSAFESVALHDAVRLGAPHSALPRLEELASVMDGSRVRLAARQARALAADDPNGLLDVAAGFDTLGMRLHAAEAAAQAASLLRHTKGEKAARAAATEAWSLAGACQGVDTPALRGLAAPNLTSRELQVAKLTAAGLSHREIAERLGIAIRTAMNHRNQAYWKLGVNSPAELAKALTRH
ncbi:helix-turn-helix transcriptional regulator [Nonomuraea endophytica]|uniref:DNA-binding CsgD family transcriptional regulator n=1 Tax=Nonomuraea endophytica TaxID=714136 RepID=A0A7W8A9H8_9ACTN|nr:LuxR family transcriptional regulator [Nonomuraea endophytica]MBB5081110.1 DNA-binding CsgD family transcriptional regulator [Nonomuraea endophytica]